MMARSNDAIDLPPTDGPRGPRVRPSVLEPGDDGFDVRQPPSRRRSARTHLHGTPPHAIDDREAELVRAIVADEEGRAAGKRRFAHERGDGAALVASRRHDLNHALASLHRVARSEAPPHGARRSMGEARKPRCAAIVQRERRSLVFEFETWVPAYDTAQALARLRPTARGKREREAMALGIAPFETMLARRRILVAGEEAIEVVERSAGDERERAVRRLPQPLHQCGQDRIDADDSRRFGQLQERAVEVKKICPTGPGNRRNLERTPHQPLLIIVCESRTNAKEPRVKPVSMPRGTSPQTAAATATASRPTAAGSPDAGPSTRLHG